MTAPDQPALGAAVKAIRKEKKISQVAVCDATAQALNVSLDYLAIDNIPRRPLRVEDHGLGDPLGQLAELDDDDRQSLLHMLDALLTRKRLRILASDGH